MLDTFSVAVATPDKVSEKTFSDGDLTKIFFEPRKNFSRTTRQKIFFQKKFFMAPEKNFFPEKNFSCTQKKNFFSEKKFSSTQRKKIFSQKKFFHEHIHGKKIFFAPKKIFTKTRNEFSEKIRSVTYNGTRS